MIAAWVTGGVATLVALLFAGWRWESARRRALEVDRDRVARAAASHLHQLRRASDALETELIRQRKQREEDTRRQQEREAVQAEKAARLLAAAEAAARIDAAAHVDVEAAAAALNREEGLE